MSGDDATPESSDTVLVPTPGLATAAVPAAEHVVARMHALVIGEKHVASYPLPDSGTITVGRSPQCEIQIDDQSVSRAHATISIGPKLTIVDLGSANGTRVRERKLDPKSPVEIVPGEAIQIGTATII